jgi:phosphate/phosphite/phosphonate ABC transporter binding protein
MGAPPVVFAHVSPSGSESALAELLGAASERLGGPITSERLESYEALASCVRDGKYDIAWLPPIVLVDAGDTVVPLGSLVRDGNASYEAALVVRADAKIRSLEGLRNVKAGWVDRWSASGYVLPCVHLALQGFETEKLFAEQTFYGSHRAAIEALTSGACDVTATYARADLRGEIATGSWTEMGKTNVRVLQTFGAIPPDVLGVRADRAEALRSPMIEALRHAFVTHPKSCRAVFGGGELREGLAAGYAALRTALDLAKSRGILRAG